MSDDTNKPFFTIVTPTLNIGDYLETCLKSIESQTYRNFEHIIIDGYSSDNTLQIVKNYKIRNPDINVKIIQKPPEGVFVAFNDGIKMAKGDYIHFLNGDDYYDNPNSLRDAYRVLMDGENIEWLQGCSALGLKKNNRLYVQNIIFKYFFFVSLSTIMLYSHQATIMSRDLLQRFGGFKTYNKTGMDPDLFVRLIAGNVPVHFAPIKVGVFRMRKGAVSQTNVIRSNFLKIKCFYARYKYIPFWTGIINTVTKFNLIKTVDNLSKIS